MKRLAGICSERRGATTIEYAAVASLISIAALVTIFAIGGKVVEFFAMVPKF